MSQAWTARLAGAAGVVVGILVRVLPGLVGLLLVSYGAWLAWPPAGFLTAGLLVLLDLIADRPGRGGMPQ